MPLSRFKMLTLSIDGFNITIIGRQSYVWMVTEATSLVLLWLLVVFGNLLVCLVIYRSRRLQSTTNFFVVSLAVSDLCVAVSVMPWVFVSVLAGRWVFGAAICKLVKFVQVALPACTMYVLVSICVDRFYTIIYPLSFKVRKTRASSTSYSNTPLCRDITMSNLLNILKCNHTSANVDASTHAYNLNIYVHRHNIPPDTQYVKPKNRLSNQRDHNPSGHSLL